MLQKLFSLKKNKYEDIFVVVGLLGSVAVAVIRYLSSNNYMLY